MGPNRQFLYVSNSNTSTRKPRATKLSPRPPGNVRLSDQKLSTSIPPPDVRPGRFEYLPPTIGDAPIDYLPHRTQLWTTPLPHPRLLPEADPGSTRQQQPCYQATAGPEPEPEPQTQSTRLEEPQTTSSSRVTKPLATKVKVIFHSVCVLLSLASFSAFLSIWSLERRGGEGERDSPLGACTAPESGGARHFGDRSVQPRGERRVCDADLQTHRDVLAGGDQHQRRGTDHSGE